MGNVFPNLNPEQAKVVEPLVTLRISMKSLKIKTRWGN